MLGLYFADAGQHLEHRLFMDHNAPHCKSRVLYKGALQGKSAHTVWVGDVLIRASAEGTDTYEMNRNLLLTEGARADSVPNLEIETGEIVGAGHASATGRFDDEQLFYLLSRGIPEPIARRLVVRGFFGEVLNKLGVDSVIERAAETIEPNSPSSASEKSFRRNTFGVQSTWQPSRSATCTCRSAPKTARRRSCAGVDLTVTSGQTHAIMGPNGSGKSTLAYSLAGHPKYQVTSGTVTLDGEDVLAMTVDDRARAGLFLAMQYPVEIPGVSTSNFLRTAATAVRGEAPPIRKWVKEVKTAMTDLEIDPTFAERNVNEGFSGGEKKRQEILQMSLLRPEDRRAGRDGLRSRRRRPAGGLRGRQPLQGAVDDPGEAVGVLLITHYTRILRYIKPDHVHVFVGGRIVESGGPDLADELETNGYVRFAGAAGAVGSRDGVTAAPVAGHRDAALRRLGDPRRLPDPGAHRPGREALGVPGFRRDVATTDHGDRRRAGIHHQAPLGRPPWRARAGRRGDRLLRRRARAHRRVHRGRASGRAHLHQERHRGDQPGGLLVG